MERGEIRWYSFKKPDKRRPVLIISRSSSIAYLNEITVAPITSVIRDIPSEILITKSEGMSKTSVANFDHIQTVSKEKIGKRIAKLSLARLEEVDNAIRFALGLNLKEGSG